MTRRSTCRRSSQIEDAERRLFELAETGRYDGGFQAFDDALAHRHRHGRRRLSARRPSVRASRPAPSTRPRMGGLQPSDLVILAGRPGMGKTSLATNIAYNIAAAYEASRRPTASVKAANGGVVGFFSLEMSSEQLATRIISEQTEISSSKIRRGEITEADFEKLVACSQMMQRMPLYIDQTGGISIAQLAARARRLKRQRGLDVLVIDYIQLMPGSSRRRRQPRAGDDRDHHRPEGARQGAERADHRAVAALAPGRKPRRQAPAALRPARIRLDRAGRRRRAVRLPRGILPQEPRSPKPGRPEIRRMEEEIRPGARARPK